MLKSRLRKKRFQEVQKVTIDLQHLNLRKSDLRATHTNILRKFSVLAPGVFYPQREFPSGEFSIWKSEHDYFSLIYLYWDDIYVWKDLYERNKVYPIAICNIAPEGANMYDGVWDVWNWEENSMPKYVIGHPSHLGANMYKEIGRVEYLGSFPDSGSSNNGLYVKIF
jgi:hypothetical protein